MDGYLRIQTDGDGRIVEIWDYWYKDEELELYMDSCGVDCYLDNYTFTPNSLLLITFQHKSEITESYLYGKEYDDWLEIVDEIILIENYNYEDLPDYICDYCGRYTPMYKEEEKGKCCPMCFSDMVGMTIEEMCRSVDWT